MKECKGCGEEISDQYAKVLGDNQDNVWGCPECRAKTENKGLKDKNESERFL